MSTTTRSVRHHEVVGSFTGGAFTASRGTRDALRPKPRSRRQLDEAALVRAIKAGIGEGVARAMLKPFKAVRDAASVSKAAEASMSKLADSMDRLKGAVDAYAENRRLRAAAARDADMSAIARHQSVTPAAVNAANRERWPGPGR